MPDNDIPRECWTCAHFNSCGLVYGCRGSQWSTNQSVMVVNSQDNIPSVNAKPNER